MRKIVTFLSLLLLMGTVVGQNITDLSVMHRTDVDSSLLNIGTYPSIVDYCIPSSGSCSLRSPLFSVGWERHFYI